MRAVAVLSVLFFHAKVPGFSGGYLGVDVFFVISGFLITSLLMRDMDAGRFAFRDFYERRIRRLLPPLVPVLLFCWAVVALQEGVDGYRNFASSLIATLGLVSNWHFLGLNSYFDPAAEVQPLLHMWSLSIEEQFYLVFPAGLLVFHGRGRFSGLIAALVLSGLSFGLALWLIDRNALDAAFFNSFARIWGLGAGVVLALALRTGLVRTGQGGAWPALGRMVGLLLVIASVVAMEPGMRIGTVSALPAVAGAMLLILCGRGADPVSALLASAPFVYVGRLSYALYLWHWPLIVFARDYVSGAPMAMVAALSLSFVLSALSYHLIESPVRSRHVLGSARAAYTGFGVTVFGLAAAIAVLLVPPVEARRMALLFGPHAMRLHMLDVENDRYRQMFAANMFTANRGRFDAAEMDGFPCSLRNAIAADLIVECLTAQLEGPDPILVIGDSIGRETYYALKGAFPDRPVAMLHDKACVPAVFVRKNRECFTNIDPILAEISARHSKLTIVLSFRYVPGEWPIIAQSLPRYTAISDRVVIVGPGLYLRQTLGQQIRAGGRDQDAPNMVPTGAVAMTVLDIDDTLSELRAIASSADVAVYDKLPFHCTNRACRLWLDPDMTQPIFWDRYHMTPTAVAAMSNFFETDAALQALLTE